MEKYIQRCFDLARLGAGFAHPNPMVGAVLVHQDRIIGEGYHRKYGTAHAEVNALRSVRPEDQSAIPQATLYVSLEPCNIHGRTPPCTDLILQHRIPKVVVSFRDATPGVAGSGLAKLRAAGVTVVEQVLPGLGKQLSLPRNTFVQAHRPYIILKYAQTSNGKFAPVDGTQHWITQPITKRLVHKWRSETAAIMVGTNTAVVDDPALTNRLYAGPSPTRVVLDRQLRIPPTAKIFDATVPTLVYCAHPPDAQPENLEYVPINFDSDALSKILQDLAARQLSTLLVEGGAQLLRQFIELNLWDEARVLYGVRDIPHGIEAPSLPVSPHKIYLLGKDRFHHFYHPRHAM